MINVLLATAVMASNGIKVSSGTLTATFDPSRRGSIVSMCNAEGREFASQLDVHPLFRVTCRQDGVLTNVCEASANDARKFTAERTSSGYRLVYEDVGRAVAKVVCTVLAKEKDPSLRWRIALTPKAGWAVTKADYPQFALAECLGSTPVDDATVVGSSRGGVRRFPMDPKRKYWKDRLVAHFPFNLVMQFGCYYDDCGGLYTAAEDNQGNTKDLLMDRWYARVRPDGSHWGGEFLLRWTRYGYATSTEEQDYDIVMRAFKGTDGEPTSWYDAADIYREWSDRQFWRKTKFLDKKSVPAWAKDAPAMIRFNREWLDRPEFIQRWLKEYWLKKFPDVPLLVHTEGWEQHGDWVGADYFPCYPTDEMHIKINEWIKAAHGHPYPWPSGHNWNFQVGKRDDGTFRLDFSKDFLSRGAAHAACNPDGSVCYSNLEWLGGGSTAGMCPGDEWTIKWWNDICCELVKRGADYVQADQDNGARVRECWSTKHGHPPGPGKWETRAMRHQFETMLEEMRKIDPWAQFSFEDMNEYYADILCFIDYRDCRYLGSEWASVWNYIFHEYTPPFQSGSELHTKPHWLAHCVVDGQMPRLPNRPLNYGFGSAPTDAGGTLEFCERWIRLYHGPARKWLAHGRQLHPPKVVCELVDYVENFRGTVVQNVKPAVHAAAWEAADGSRAVCFANATDYDQTIAWTWKGETRHLKMGSREIKIVEVK